jgi:AraC-like DNA-binding protein
MYAQSAASDAIAENVRRPWSSTMSTDRPGERLAIHRMPGLEGVEFWSVTGSTRHWTMYHETYTVSHVRGPRSMTAKWRYRGRERVVAAGHVQLMEPGEIHRTTGVSEPATFFVAWLPPKLVAQLAEEIALGSSIHLKHSQVEHPELTSAMTLLEDALSRAHSSLEVEHWFAEATRCLLESCFEISPQPARFGPQHPAVRKARACLEARFAENISLGELAAEAGLSKFHLARSFTQAVGVPPHRYQTLLRVSAARRMLACGDSLKRASEASGFADEAHLTRWFKRELGVPPGAWRRALRGS